jgi:hypothetical protein
MELGSLKFLKEERKGRGREKEEGGRRNKETIPLYLSQSYMWYHHLVWSLVHSNF